MKKINYLMLSSFTGFVEIGTVFFLSKNGFSINQILFVILFYQIGCFFPVNIQLNNKILLLLCFFSLILYASMIINGFSFIKFLITFIQTSVLLQSARNFQKTKVSTGVKRLFRVIGFAAAPFFNIHILFVMMIVTTAILLLGIGYNNHNSLNFSSIGYDEIIMIFHQFHYFVYSYFIIIILLVNLKLSSFFTSLIFVLGWLTYLLVPYLLKGQNYRKYFLIGHLFLTVVLVSMYFTNSSVALIILWVLTGLGGGTVFCIEKLVSEQSNTGKPALELAENIGHVAGVLIGIIVYNIHFAVKIPILYSSIFAFIAFIMMLLNNKANNTLS